MHFNDFDSLYKERKQHFSLDIRKLLEDVRDNATTEYCWQKYIPYSADLIYQIAFEYVTGYAVGGDPTSSYKEYEKYLSDADKFAIDIIMCLCLYIQGLRYETNRDHILLKK